MDVARTADRGVSIASNLLTPTSFLKMRSNSRRQTPRKPRKSIGRSLKPRSTTVRCLARADLSLIEKKEFSQASDLLENFIGGQSGSEIERLKAILALRTEASELGEFSVLQAKVQTHPKYASALFRSRDWPPRLVAITPTPWPSCWCAGEADKKLAQS